MSIPGLITAGVMLAALVFYVLRPVFTRSVARRATIDRQRERALAYYERVLTNIRDLDEDRATGKIAEVEYTDEREVWVERGVKLLKMLDSLESQGTLADSGEDADIDSAIEQAIAAVREKQQMQGLG